MQIFLYNWAAGHDIVVELFVSTSLTPIPITTVKAFKVGGRRKHATGQIDTQHVKYDAVLPPDDGPWLIRVIYMLHVA